VYMQDRWNKSVYNLRKQRQAEPTLSHLIQLVDEEASLASDPLFSRGALNEVDKRNTTHGVKSFYADFPTEVVRDDKSCVVCDKTHDLEKCPKYNALKSFDRKKLVYRKRLCFCCLKPTSTNHTAKVCKQKRTCNICKSLHPISFHDSFNQLPKEPAQTRTTTTTTSFSTALPSNTISLCIIPVIEYLLRSQSKVLLFSTTAHRELSSMKTFLKVLTWPDDTTPEHYFQFKESIKDLSIREMLLAMYETDFHESAAPHSIIKNSPAVSVEDKKFLQLMDSEAKQILGHFQLPLPVRYPEKQVPNNRHQAVQRAQCLMKRLKNNPKLHKDYVSWKVFLQRAMQNDQQHYQHMERLGTSHTMGYIIRKNLRKFDVCSTAVCASKIIA